MSSERPFLIVTGAGRSGTSAVARVLHESGVRMGHRLAPPSEANPEGFYEDLDVVALNERILADVDMSDPWRPERWASRSEVLEAVGAYRDEMAALAGEALDGWKDPRFSITLEAWLDTLPSRPNVIVCLRSPEAYAASVTNVYGLVKPARAMREWARHYRRLLAVIRARRLSATCVEYDALVERPAEVVEELATFVGRPLDARYVAPALRRQYGPVPEAYRALYERVAEIGGSRVEGRGSRSGPGVRGQGSRVKERVESSFASLRPGSSRVETKGYGALAERLVARLNDARAAWESAVSMPSFEQTDEVRGACEAYNALLTEAQREIVELVPPAALLRNYEALRGRINLERMIAQLALNAASSGDGRARRMAARAWRKSGRKPVTLVSQHDRSHE